MRYRIPIGRARGGVKASAKRCCCSSPSSPRRRFAARYPGARAITCNHVATPRRYQEVPRSVPLTTVVPTVITASAIGLPVVVSVIWPSTFVGRPRQRSKAPLSQHSAKHFSWRDRSPSQTSLSEVYRASPHTFALFPLPASQKAPPIRSPYTTAQYCLRTYLAANWGADSLTAMRPTWNTILAWFSLALPCYSWWRLSEQQLQARIETTSRFRQLGSQSPGQRE